MSNACARSLTNTACYTATTRYRVSSKPGQLLGQWQWCYLQLLWGTWSIGYPAQLRPVKKVIVTATAVTEVTFLTTNPPQTMDVDELIAVSGLVFEDANHNGLRDEGELVLKGVTISAEMADDATSQVVTLTMTDERGEFHLQASSRALISIQVPEGFRPVSPITRFAAAEQLVFGLRTDTMTIERVVQSPPVNIIAPPPLHITPEIAFALGAFGLLSLVFAAIVIRHQSQQTQA